MSNIKAQMPNKVQISNNLNNNDNAYVPVYFGIKSFDIDLTLGF
jgi:hypothetical protein